MEITEEIRKIQIDMSNIRDFFFVLDFIDWLNPQKTLAKNNSKF